MPTAIGYARISDKDQSHNSIEDQVEQIAAYCQQHGLTLVHTFIDRGRSAFTFDRPEWLNLEKFVKKNRPDFLIVKHLDRFSRANLMDALIKINELEQKLKVKVLTVTDPLDLNTEDLGVQMLRTIGLLFSNNERNRIRERSMDGMYKSLSDGRYCSNAPIGYLNSTGPDGKPILKIDPERSKLIKLIFRLYLEGMEMEEIRNEVIKKGFKRSGNSAIRRILENPVYAGLVHVPAYKKNPSRIIEGLHSPIISTVDYWNAQKRLNQKPHNVSQNSEDVPLRGVLHCTCGRLLTAGKSRGKMGAHYWYYVCKTEKKNYSAKRVHAWFDKVLELLCMSPEDVSQIRGLVESAISEHLNKKGGNIMRVNLELEKVQRKIATAERKNLLDETSPEVFKQVMTELRADESRLQDDLVKADTSTATYRRMLSEVLPAMTNIKQVYYGWPLHQKHLFINTVFNHSLQVNGVAGRTQTINPLFAHNAHILKEKGLLEIIEEPLNFVVAPISAPGGN